MGVRREEFSSKYLILANPFILKEGISNSEVPANHQPSMRANNTCEQLPKVRILAAGSDGRVPSPSQSRDMGCE